MERLIKPVSDGGAPYINQDFFQYLQQNHVTSYSTFLDEINDTRTGNCGIIIKGLTPSFGVSIFINSKGEEEIIPDGIIYKPENSLVYLDGEFLEPAPWIATYSFPYSNFYIKKASAGKIRRFTKVYDFLTDIIQENYYDISQTNPGQGNYIYVYSLPIQMEIGKSSNFGNVNFTHLEFLKTYFREPKNGYPFGLGSSNNFRLSDQPPSRYLNRILKYYMAEEGEIYQTYDLRWFSGDGVGFGDMFGFRLIEGSYSDLSSIPAGFLPDRFLPDRYTIGFSTSSNSSISNITTSTSIPILDKPSKLNYNKIGNLGGTDSVLLFPENLPPHNHGTMSGTPSNNLHHFHYIKVSDNSRRVTNFPNEGMYLVKSAVVRHEGRPSTGGYFRRPGNGAHSFQLHVPSDTNLYEVNTDGTPVYQNDQPVLSNNLQDHTHLTRPELTSSSTNTTIDPINNLPPSINIAYYIKYNPYA